MESVLELLLNEQGSHLFEFPVDTKKYLDYLSVIEHPMDFQTVRNKIEATQKNNRDSGE
jgi:hypothetical protein